MSNDESVTIIDVGPGHMGLVDVVQRKTSDEQVGKAVLQAIRAALPPHQASQVCFADPFSDKLPIVEDELSHE